MTIVRVVRRDTPLPWHIYVTEPGQPERLFVSCLHASTVDDSAARLAEHYRAEGRDVTLIPRDQAVT